MDKIEAFIFTGIAFLLGSLLLLMAWGGHMNHVCKLKAMESHYQATDIRAICEAD